MQQEDHQRATSGAPKTSGGARFFSIAALLLLLVLTLDWALEPDFGEPLGLRWVRSAAEHPVRTWIALGLFLKGLCKKQVMIPG